MVKIGGMGPSLYFEDSWNRFDFFLVSISIIGKLMEFTLGNGLIPVPASVGRILRTFRLAARIFRVVGRLVRLFRGWKEKYDRENKKKQNDNWLLKATMKAIHRQLGPNVGMIFVFYNLIMQTQFIMVCCWLGLVIIPWILGPPEASSKHEHRL